MTSPSDRASIHIKSITFYFGILLGVETANILNSNRFLMHKHRFFVIFCVIFRSPTRPSNIEDVEYEMKLLCCLLDKHFMLRLPGKKMRWIFERLLRQFIEREFCRKIFSNYSWKFSIEFSSKFYEKKSPQFSSLFLEPMQLSPDVHLPINDPRWFSHFQIRMKNVPKCLRH